MTQIYFPVLKSIVRHAPRDLPMNYAELHCKTNFSFLTGASHPQELVMRAAELGYVALAITDINSLAGVVRAHGEAKQHGLKLIIGAEITPTDAPAVVLLAPDKPAYGRLARLITRGRRTAPKGECELTLSDIDEFREGLIACAVPDAGDELVDQDSVGRYREIFHDRCHLLCELSCGPHDESRLETLLSLSKATRVPLVAAGDVHLHAPSRLRLQHVLTAVRHGVRVADAGHLLAKNAERHLRSLERVRATFHRVPEAIERTLQIAGECTFSLDELRYDYPIELAPDGMTPIAYLRKMAWQGAHKRYRGEVPRKVARLLEHELALIEELRYEAYFLTVFDLVRFARRRGILCQGRGSAANSAVCYCLGVTSVDPEQMDLLFERFVSRERNEAPDIDVDFEHERREEVIQYVYEKYGRQRAGMTAEVITYRPRSAVRDVGKALGLSLDRVDTLAGNIDGYMEEKKLADRCRASGIDPASKIGRDLIDLVEQIVGFPRHLSQHVGGLVVTHSPLCELVPIENAAMPGRTVIQWNKDDLDELGILKVDCLALGMLTAIRKCFALLKQHTARRLSLATVPPEAPRVYEMICRADTVGVFQVESRGQMSMLPRLRPRCFYDLVIEIAIVRPGPIQGNMVHPYLRRRQGLEQAEYPNDAIREVLHKTLGVPLFQEQAMRLAMVAADFTPGEADQLRRAMAAWRRPGIIHQFREKLLAGMRRNGFSDQFAEMVYEQIHGFGSYGFPESHAASFARLAYVSAWLKCHHPGFFTAALLNSQPLGFYAPAQLVRDAREHGVEVLPVDVNHSDWDCTLEEHAGRYSLRLGMRIISGLPEKVGRAIEEARTSPFVSVHDLATRAGLGRPILERLADADALGSLALDRRNGLWHALDEEKVLEELPLLAGRIQKHEPRWTVPSLSEWDEVVADYQTKGLSLRRHPMSFVRDRLRRKRVITSAALEQTLHGRLVKIAGLILLRQRPSTAKGITFVTMEDETGTSNLVLYQSIWEQFYPIAKRSGAWLAHGRVQREGQVIHVVVSRLEDLARQLSMISAKSRDFR